MNETNDFMKRILESALKKFKVKVYEIDKILYTEHDMTLLELLIKLIHNHDTINFINIFQKEGDRENE